MMMNCVQVAALASVNTFNTNQAFSSSPHHNYIPYQAVPSMRGRLGFMVLQYWATVFAVFR